MCLGIPGQVIELLAGNGGQLALVDVEGAARKINIGLLDEGTLAPGDWILIHMGMALEKVDRQRAADARSGLELLGREAPEAPRTPQAPQAHPTASAAPAHAGRDTAEAWLPPYGEGREVRP